MTRLLTLLLAAVLIRDTMRRSAPQPDARRATSDFEAQAAVVILGHRLEVTQAQIGMLRADLERTRINRLGPGERLDFHTRPATSASAVSCSGEASMHSPAGEQGFPA